jgi:hypothetical protein
MSQLAEDAERDHRPAGYFSANGAQLVNCVAEPAQLLFENLLRERVLIRCGKRVGRLDVAGRAVGGVGSDSQFVADCSLDDEVERDASMWLGARECLSQLCGELRVIGLPKLLAGL